MLVGRFGRSVTSSSIVYISRRACNHARAIAAAAPVFVCATSGQIELLVLRARVEAAPLAFVARHRLVYVDWHFSTVCHELHLPSLYRPPPPLALSYYPSSAQPNSPSQITRIIYIYMGRAWKVEKWRKNGRYIGRLQKEEKNLCFFF